MTPSTPVDITIGIATILIALLGTALWNYLMDGLGDVPDEPIEFDDTQQGDQS